jgi:hypothetical protein
MPGLSYKSGCYLAFVLSKGSREDLIKLFPPTFEKVICHHVTIAFNLDEQMFDNIISTIGETPRVVATGFMIGKNIECFSIAINDINRSSINGQHYHITHSLESPAKPVDSNRLVTSDEPSRKLHAELFGKLELIKK